MIKIDEAEVKAVIAKFLKQPLDKITDDVAIADLVHESFVLVHLAIELQEEFKIRLTQDDLKDIETVGDLIKLFR